ncbi:hypothetical protein [Streptomyces sp. NBC_00503]|uniref:hypothetical protein n=1 Tax=Streptomyces sp. NBC_00503 TaxID=2903659 RepID=UPI002E801295|nr:hypothetical protein [Streptomyces sp. NBC_00503]WUD80151.1 hypothetical protein OG490_06030 [Streptomyces sp. NBC_00503]
MKLTKRLVTISTAATAAVLLSAGGAQAQDDGDFLSFLGSTTLPQASTPVQVGHGNTYIGTQNINTNNNIGGGVNNNNNNNNSGGRTQSHDDDDSGLFSLLHKTALVPASYSVQVGEGNSYTETQNNNTNNNLGGGTNNNNNNNGGGVNNNNNNNNIGGGTNNNNNNNGGEGTNNNNNNNNGGAKDKAVDAHDDAATRSVGGVRALIEDATRSHLQTCYPIEQAGLGDTYIGTLNISCNQH